MLRRLFLRSSQARFSLFTRRGVEYSHGGVGLAARIRNAPVVSPTARLVPGAGRIILAPNVYIQHGAELECMGGTISIGRKTHILRDALLYAVGGSITIGERCSINPFCAIYGHGGLRIGNRVRIAAAVVIIPSNHDFDDPAMAIAAQGNTSLGITIDDDVWVGAGARILDGVTIGKGSVIGAGAVVTKCVKPYSVMGGVPAKLIRSRLEPGP